MRNRGEHDRQGVKGRCRLKPLCADVAVWFAAGLLVVVLMV